MKLPLTIPLRVSRRLVIFLVAAHLLAIVAIPLLMLSWPLRLAMIGLVVVSLVYFIDRQLRQPVTGLRLGAQGEFAVETKVGVTEGNPLFGTGEMKCPAAGTATILPQTTVLSRVIVLCLRKNGQRLTLPLLPDSTGETAYRQLSLWLKWRAKLG